MKKQFGIALLIGALSFSCQNEAQLKYVQDKDMLAQGKEISMKSFKALSGELKKAVNSGGPLNGVEVCNKKAMQITDSLSNVFGVQIKRTSLKLRNQNNKADQLENIQLEKWANSQDEQLQAVLFEVDNGVEFMAPITLGPPCMACHGDPEKMNADLKSLISEKYPHDKATGFNIGDLRGAWVIKFDK
jgi:hypothetical protein